MDSVTLGQIVDFVEKSRPVDVDGIKSIVVGNGDNQRTVSLDAFRLTPTRARGLIQTASNTDFAALVGALDPDFSMRAYYTPAGQFCYILNDDINVESTLKPAWRDHCITYMPDADDAWKAWMRTFGGPDEVKPKWIDQLAFAEFVQERLQDFQTPPGLAMLELAQKFDLHRSGKFMHAHRLDNGNTTLTVTEDTKPAGDGVTIPNKLVLGMRVFEDQAEGYSFGAYFRYRLIEGHKLIISVMIEDKPKILKRAVDDMVKETKALLPKVAFYKVASMPAPTAWLSTK